MNSAFDVRTTIEGGWSTFRRQGDSEDPKAIAVNFDYLDHLCKAGLNWVIVGWANSRGFDDAWRRAVPYAHSIGLKVMRAIYGFNTEPRHDYNADGVREPPDAPAHLLRDSANGPGTSLCPHDPETREWLVEELKRLIEPEMDGLDIEPARHVGRRCACARCQAMKPYEWDVFATNFLAEHILRIKAGAEIYMHVNVALLASGGDDMKNAYRRLNPKIRHIFGWGADDERTMGEWLDLDPRFEHFAKLGRVLLFPGGEPPATPASERVARIFRWCRFSAEKGKKGYAFDYLMFGGAEWVRKGAAARRPAIPATRLARRLPASIAVMGAAMLDPFLNGRGQCALLDALKKEADWDLEDPQHFWRGEAGPG